ncbi:MAG: hypothetical protein ACTHOJ_12525 [Sphingomonas oligoaromativorans]
MIAAAILLSVAAPSQSCDLGAVTSARAVHDVLGRRAVETIALASAENSKADERLNAYVDPSATFDLGAGDVGRPLGSGAAGVRAMATAMNADQFQFLGWDYMDSPSDACGKQTITVDFINSTNHEMSQVEFTFVGGRIIAAKGWQRSLETGPLASHLPDRNGS